MIAYQINSLYFGFIWDFRVYFAIVFFQLIFIFIIPKFVFIFKIQVFLLFIWIEEKFFKLFSFFYFIIWSRKNIVIEKEIWFLNWNTSVDFRIFSLFFNTKGIHMNLFRHLTNRKTILPIDALSNYFRLIKFENNLN